MGARTILWKVPRGRCDKKRSNSVKSLSTVYFSLSLQFIHSPILYNSLITTPVWMSILRITSTIVRK